MVSTCSRASSASSACLPNWPGSITANSVAIARRLNWERTKAAIEFAIAMGFGQGNRFIVESAVGPGQLVAEPCCINWCLDSDREACQKAGKSQQSQTLERWLSGRKHVFAKDATG